MDDQPHVKLRHLLDAVQELSVLIDSSEAQVDEHGAPLPGTPTARIMLLLALYQPTHRAGRPGRN